MDWRESGAGMDREQIRWISREILPHEPDVRRWLSRRTGLAQDADDIVQECYSRIARSVRPDEVRSGRAYFFRAVRNLLIERVRREKLVRIEAMAEIDALFVVDESPGADRVVQDRQELSLVMALMERLPARARDILMLRRVEGLSQRETAERLGVSENVVEKQSARALGKLLAMLREGGAAIGEASRKGGSHERQRNAR